MGIVDDLTAIGQKLHRDGWKNTITGLGVWGKDRAVSTFFDRSCELDDQTLSNLYHYSDLPALIVDIYPEEALRRGMDVELPEEAEERWKNKLLVRQTIQEAARWGRLYGRAIVVIGAEDGRSSSEPIDLSVPRPVSFLEVFDRQSVTPILGPSGLYSRAEAFRVTRQNGGQFTVHTSRCLVFGGAPTSQRVREGRSGADLSVLQRPYEIIRDFSSGYLALGNMLTDASQGVFTMKGLISGLAGKKREELVARLSLMDTARSVANAIMLDADGGEDFKKVPTAFSGVPETVDRLIGRLSVATGIPVEYLGQALAGLNTTGESTTRRFYDRVEAYREDAIEPRVRYLARVELGPGAPVCVSFPALWQPTDTELATNAKTKIDAAVALADREAVTPEELSQLAASIGVTIDPSVPRAVPPPAVGAPPPAGPVVQGDDEATVPDEMSAAYAEQLTSRQAETCLYHPTIRNRCRTCGVERQRGLDPATGVPIIAWRAIPR